MEPIEVSAKNVDDAVTDALVTLGVTSDRLEYEVIEKGSNGFLGIGNKPAIIKAWIKEEPVAEEPEVEEVPEEVEKTIEEPVIEAAAETVAEAVSSGYEKTSDIEELKKIAGNFLAEVLDKMDLSTTVDMTYDEAEKELYIDVQGKHMGILIGKRGQTLDALQYLVSLVVNRRSEDYIRIKLDTENYRERRKETLENLARNIASKVKRTQREVSLEPMSPYERRIIHYALQDYRDITTESEGEGAYRHIVVKLK